MRCYFITYFAELDISLRVLAKFIDVTFIAVSDFVLYKNYWYVLGFSIVLERVYKGKP